MLTYYDFTSGTPTTDFFRNVNGFGLGDTGSDFIIYGGKMYIVMNVSGYVAVANGFTAKFIDTISFKNAGVNRGPENIVAAAEKYLCHLPTERWPLSIPLPWRLQNLLPSDQIRRRWWFPETILYVSNTGGFSATFDSTVSVIPLNSLTETGKITVGINPGSLATDNSGNIYVVCTGDYGTVAPRLVKVNLNSNTVVKSVDSALEPFDIINNYLHNRRLSGCCQCGYILNTTDLGAVRASLSLMVQPL